MPNSPNFGQFASLPNGRAVPPSAVGSDFDIRFHTLTDTSGSAQKLLDGNSDRLAVMIPAVASGQQLYYHWFDFSQNDQANLQANAMIPVVFSFRDLGAMIGEPFYYSISLFGAGPTITEIVYKPNR